MAVKQSAHRHAVEAIFVWLSHVVSGRYYDYKPQYYYWETVPR